MPKFNFGHLISIKQFAHLSEPAQHTQNTKIILIQFCPPSFLCDYLCVKTMSLRAAASQLSPMLRQGGSALSKRGLNTSSRTLAEESKAYGGKGQMTHEELTRGDGHHGLRPGYSYVSVCLSVTGAGQARQCAVWRS